MNRSSLWDALNGTLRLLAAAVASLLAITVVACGGDASAVKTVTVTTVGTSPTQPNDESSGVTGCSATQAVKAILGSSLSQTMKVPGSPVPTISPRVSTDKIVDLICYDFTGDAQKDMAVSVTGGGSGGAVGWALFRRDAEGWQLAFHREGALGYRLSHQGDVLMETLPELLPGDANCCPSRFVHTPLQWNGQTLVPVEEAPSDQTTACGLLTAGTALFDQVRVSNIGCPAARGLLSRAILASVRKGRTRWSYRGWDWTLRPRDEASAKISGTSGTATITGVWVVF